MKFGFPLAEEKRVTKIKKARLPKQAFLMDCKEMESGNTRKLNDRVVFGEI